VKQAIESELGPKNARGTDLVTIGDNGNTVINESVVFDFGSYAVKKEAKPLLDTQQLRRRMLAVPCCAVLPNVPFHIEPPGRVATAQRPCAKSAFAAPG
jgi:hypothetical protein